MRHIVYNYGLRSVQTRNILVLPLKLAVLRDESIEPRALGGNASLGRLVCVPPALPQPRLVRLFRLDEACQIGAESFLVAETENVAARLALKLDGMKRRLTSTMRWIRGTPPPPHASSVQLASDMTLWVS